MKSMLARVMCRVLAVGLAILPWQANAGLIGTEQAAERTTVGGFVARAEVAAQLQSFGISAHEAQQRVAALSDAEVADLAGRVESLPSGGIAGLLPIIVVALLIWHFTGDAQSAGKAGSKPAPEKK